MRLLHNMHLWQTANFLARPEKTQNMMNYNGVQVAERGLELYLAVSLQIVRLIPELRLTILSSYN